MNKYKIVDRLGTYRGQLTESSSGISTINRKVREAESYLEGGLTSSYTRGIAQKFEHFEEKQPYNHSDFTSASSYVQDEIQAVYEEIREEEARAAAAAAAAAAARAKAQKL